MYIDIHRKEIKLIAFNDFRISSGPHRNNKQATMWLAGQGV